MQIEIDFSAIQSLSDMHKVLKKTFGFPDFYGANVNALIDCWTSLRYPKDGMTSISINKNEVLEMKVKSLSTKPILILNHFLIAVEAVNQRYSSKGKTIPISLTLI